MDMTAYSLLPLTLALPLAGVVLLTLFGGRLGGARSGVLATAIVGLTFLVAVAIALDFTDSVTASGSLPDGSAGIGSAEDGSTGDVAVGDHGVGDATGDHGVDESGLLGDSSSTDDQHGVVAPHIERSLWTWIRVKRSFADYELVPVTIAARDIPDLSRITPDMVAVVEVQAGTRAGPRTVREELPLMWDPEAIVGVQIFRGAITPGTILSTRVATALGADDKIFVPADLASPGFTADVSLTLDGLSLLMLLIVTGVGFLIHLFSIGYMAHDPDRRRYFTYLNLFIFSMLVLVLGGNFLMLFVGWELVGACSYLLIGFWHRDPANAWAGRKAFIVNRIGDMAFVIGLMLIWTTYGSLAFADVLPAAAGGAVTGSIAIAIPALLLIGATGKSAQLPLFVWLPDAMAGPTPVSALIHAATMVTAGVYMIARAHPLFEAAPVVLAAVAIVGAATALMAALIALVQVDIKRVLAYSTVSQLGYMFMAVGAGAYAAGVFHLMTHAFFKALLFLGAGSVMHAMEHGFAHGGAHPADGSGRESASMSDASFDPPLDAPSSASHAPASISTPDLDVDGHSEVDLGGAGASSPPRPDHFTDVPAHQDMRMMGGLLSRAPITGWTFLVGGLALAGVFPLAGFWSKDEILLETLARAGGSDGGTLWVVLYGVGLFTALLTAIYTGRQLLMVLAGAPRSTGAKNAAESPWTMTLPLVVLAVLSAVGGLVVLQTFGAPLLHLLEPVLGAHPAEGGPSKLNMALMASAASLSGLAIAYALYGARAIDPDRIATALPVAYRWLSRKLMIDELYDAVVVHPFQRLAPALWHRIDEGVLDRVVNGAGRSLIASAQAWRHVQNGRVRSYGLSIALGAVALGILLVFADRLSGVLLP